MPFPREQPISQHDLISATELSLFEEFDQELASAGYNETRTDFDFTEVPLPGQPLHGGQAHLVARPRPGVSQKVWVLEFDPNSGNSWYENAQVDSRGDVVDQNGQPVGAPANAPAAGVCAGCGTNTNLPNGTTAVFCPSCGQRQPSFVIPAVLPHQLAGQLAAALGTCTGCGNQLPPGSSQSLCSACLPGQPAAPPPNYDPNRMTGKQKAPVVIPEGMGKVDGKEDFFAFLDKAIDAGKDDVDPEPTPVEPEETTQ